MKTLIQYTLIITTLALSAVSAQNYNQLLKEKENLIKDAKHLNEILLETKSSQTHTLEALGLINNKIEIQENLLKILTQELEILEREERDMKNRLDMTIIELTALKKNYAKLIESAHKLTRSYNRLLFFLSSTSFNQLIRRAYHFRQLEANRRGQYLEIEALQKDIVEKKKIITAKKAKQSDLTFIKNKEIALLKKSKTSKEETVSILKTKADSLLQAIKAKDLETKKITTEILKILEKKHSKENNLTPELTLISNNFISNKGRLPWPVNRGTIISKFGKVPHPILSGITVINNGIEISTNVNSVRSVFDGEVSKIIILPTGLKVVIIRHGNYLTVYSNLEDVDIKKGQKIKTKEIIGRLYTNKQKNNNILGFQIWKGREKLDPVHWISR